MDLKPHEELLLALASPIADRGRVDSLVSATSEADEWTSFVSLANENGVIALVYDNLVAAGLIKNVPVNIAEQMRSAWLASLARNTHIFKLLHEVATHASGRQIKIIPIKGLYLEKHVFGEKGVRQMNDLDILVDERDAVPLRNLLIENGFTTMPFISPIHSFFLHSYGKHMPEMYKHGLSFEIHFRLFSDKGNSLTHEMVRLSHRPFDDKNYHIICPDEAYHFLFLVKHLAWHEKGGTSQLRLYADMAYVIERRYDKILWDEIYILAHHAWVKDELNRVLYLTKRFLGQGPGCDDLPDKERAEEEFISFIRNPKKGHENEHPDGFSGQIANVDGLLHKFLFVVGMIFPSLTFMKWRYGAESRVNAIKYYPVRWWTMMRKVMA